MKKLIELKRILTVLSAVTLLATFSSCGKTSEKGSSNVGNNTSNLSVDEKTFAGLKFDTGKNIDLGGREMIFGDWMGVPEAGTSEYNDRLLAREAKTEAKYNVKIKHVALASNVDFVQNVLLAYSSGKKIADSIFCPSNYGIELLKVKGVAVPLDDYIDYSNARFDFTDENGRFVDGKHYSYMPVSETRKLLGNICYYNATLLEAAGCEDIFELYKKGKWNWDAMLDIIRKTTVVKDGVTTQYGIGGSMLLDSLLASNGVRLIYPNYDKGAFECGLYSEAGYNALNVLKKITFDIKGADGWYGGHNSIENFKQSKVAILLAPLYYGGNFVSIGMDVKTAPLPLGNDVKNYSNVLSYAEWNLVSGQSDFKPEEVLQVAFDAMRNDPDDPDTYDERYDDPKVEKEESVLDFMSGNYFVTEEECEFFYDFVHDKKTNTFVDFTSFGVQGILRDKIFNPIAGGEDPRSYLDSVKPVIDEMLKDMLPK